MVKLGIIGLGARAETLLVSIFALADEVTVTAICDRQEERIAKITAIFERHGQPRPRAYRDFHELLADDAVEAVLVPTSWNSHLAIALAALKVGKYAGIEVGGAASVDELWQLVHMAEATGGQCMMLENCCYGRDELMVLNMVRQGLFGELIYCECGYEHDLSDEIVPRLDAHFERAMHNLCRNGDLYPTHGLGPIAKILNINRGNRFLTLTATATKSRGFADYLRRSRPELTAPVFNCGDVVTTVIRCANGEVITLTHSISLPRPYSRDCRVQGTRGIWLENARGIYIDGISPSERKLDAAGNPYTEHEWSPVADFYESYDHPIWRACRDNVVGGHGGMDALALRAFFDAVNRRAPTPIDVYDCAAWMSVSALSEASVAMSGAPVAFPDFTNGKWVDRAPEPESVWKLS